MISCSDEKIINLNDLPSVNLSQTRKGMFPIGATGRTDQRDELGQHQSDGCADGHSERGGLHGLRGSNLGSLFGDGDAMFLQAGGGSYIGFLSVLHTWGQNLQIHPHVHCVIPAPRPVAGSLALDSCPAPLPTSRQSTHRP